MINRIYMLFDNVSQCFVGPLSIIVNDAVALRNFKSVVNSSQFPYKGMEDDLKLYCLGSINIEDGHIDSDIKFICNLSDFAVKKES